MVDRPEASAGGRGDLPNRGGNPTGLPISPLLANIALHVLDEAWREHGRGRMPFGATVSTVRSSTSLVVTVARPAPSFTVAVRPSLL